MFNLTDKIKDQLLEQCLQAGEIAHNLYNLYINLNYTYFGKKVSKGTIEVFTAGEYKKFRFAEKNGWAQELELIK